MIPGKPVFLAEGRLSNSVLPTHKYVLLPANKTYFHPFVISSVHNYEWEKLRRGRGGGELQNILQKALPFYFKVLITTDDLHLQEMASVPRRDAPSFL